MSNTILVINAGSSSIKFFLYEISQGDALSVILGGQLDGIATQIPHLKAKNAQGTVLIDKDLDPAAANNVSAAQTVVDNWLVEQSNGTPLAVGHRVVHGGSEFSAPILIDDEVLKKLTDLTSLAPLHQPNNLAPIKMIKNSHPTIPQIACFDTAFHRTHSEVADRFAIPQTFYDQGIRRYGFHGLSYAFIAKQLGKIDPKLAQGKVVVAHLGSGASACAIQNGKSVDSTMSFSALDGLPMGTRPGRLDPGVMLWMMRKGMTVDEIQHTLYHQSGLKGLSGISNDMRELLESDKPSAKLALDFFAWRVAENIAGLGCAMNGIDALIFTAGVGENAPAVRASICAHLEWLGININAENNAKNQTNIATSNSKIGVYVVPTNEELVIAQYALEILRKK